MVLNRNLKTRRFNPVKIESSNFLIPMLAHFLFIDHFELLVVFLYSCQITDLIPNGQFHGAP